MLKQMAAPTRVRSVEKAARILGLVAGGRQGLPARDVASRLGMPVPTTYHLMETLAAAGLLVKGADRRYGLGPAVGLLSDAFLDAASPPEFLLAPLRALAAETGETAYLSRWEDGDAVIVRALEGAHQLRVGGLHTGTRGDAHARASGKVFLAHLSDEARAAYLEGHELRARTTRTITARRALSAELARVRETGHALDREEFADGVCSLSAPVWAGGAVVAAYAVAAPATRFRVDGGELTRAVLTAAAAASA
jgi:DNA-binding IclR family transcriptional regulator